MGIQNNSAIPASQITRLHELVYELEISQVMTREVITVTPQTSMTEVREILQRHRISGIPVLEHGELVGIISIEDLIKALAGGEMDARVGEKMTPNPIVLSANEPLVLSVDYFNRYGFGRFPIVNEQGKMVGILTPSDVTQGLLKKLEVEYHEEEIRRYRASHIFEDVISDHTSIFLHYIIASRDFKQAGAASRNIKRTLTHLGIPRPIIRRAAIATYEAEINIIIHTDDFGGLITAEIRPDAIIIGALDLGPGIADVEQAKRRGFSTAPDWIREMGFGAGMGLTNIEKCADEMYLESPFGSRTTLRVTIYMDEHLPIGRREA